MENDSQQRASSQATLVHWSVQKQALKKKEKISK